MCCIFPKHYITELSFQIADILHRHPSAHVQRGDGHVPHRRTDDACHHPGLHVHADRDQQDHSPSQPRRVDRSAAGRQHLFCSRLCGQPLANGIPALDRQPDQDHSFGSVQPGPRHPRVQRTPERFPRSDSRVYRRGRLGLVLGGARGSVEEGSRGQTKIPVDSSGHA